MKCESKIVGCKNKGCCYGPGGGVSKCKKCDDEYKKFVAERKK